MALMGKDFWPYGIGGNEKTLEAFLQYHHGQGLTRNRLTLEDLFIPATMEAFKI